MNKALTLAAALLFGGLNFHAGAVDDLARLIPDSADAAVGINVENIVNSPVVVKALADPQCKGVRAKVDAVAAFVGVDPFKDVKRIVYFRKVDAGEESVGIAAQGVFDETRLTRMLGLNQQYSTTTVSGGTVLHMWQAKGEALMKYGVFLPNGIIVVCNSEYQMKNVLDRNAAIDQLQRIYPGTETDSAWIMLPSPERPSPTDPGFGKFHIMGFNAVLNFSNEDLKVRSELKFDTPEHAADGVKVMEGVAAAGRLQDMNPFVKDLAKKLQVRLSDDKRSVLVEGSAPAAALLTMIAAKVCGI